MKTFQLLIDKIIIQLGYESSSNFSGLINFKTPLYFHSLKEYEKKLKKHHKNRE